MTAKQNDSENQVLRRELLKTREELDQRYHDLSRIYEIVNSIHSTLKLSELSHASKSIIDRTLGLKAFSLVVYDSVEKQFLVVETKNLDKNVEQMALDQVKKSAESLKKHNKRDYKTQVIEIEGDDGVKLIYIPLIAYRRIVGGLCTNQDFIAEVDWSGEEMLSLVTSQLTVALENSILYEMTRKLSITDDKTKVYNHRYLIGRLNLEWRRAQRYVRNLSVMMIDVDEFKGYNDEFGHVKGDKVLAEVATILTSLSRDIDVVARYGGDEFAVIIPETDLNGAAILATRIEERMAKHRFEGRKGRDQTLMLSIGIATFPEHTSDVHEIIKLADKALYEAKQIKGSSHMVAKTSKV
jgi:diguanylate cyclase (GGDEF)-like protein